MSAGSSEFEELLELAKSGDSDALSEISQTYAPQIRAIARVQIGPALQPYLDSVDIVQSIQKSIVTGLVNEKFRFTCREELMALMVLMVKRKVARHWKKLKRQQRLSGEIKKHESLQQLITNLVPDRSVDDSPELEQELQIVLNGLHTTDRNLIELRLNGYNTSDAAKKLGLDADVARVRLSRVRKKLRDHQMFAEFF